MKRKVMCWENYCETENSSSISCQ